MGFYGPVGLSQNTSVITDDDRARIFGGTAAALPKPDLAPDAWAGERMNVHAAAPRIPPLSGWDAELGGLLAQTRVGRQGQPLNVFMTLARHPRLLSAYNALGRLFRQDGSLPVRERELVILRVAYRTGCVYEFGHHTVIGGRCGLADEEISALTLPLADGDWSGPDRAMLTVADELLERDTVGDGAWAAAADGRTDAQMIELVVLVGFYRMLAGFLNAVGVPREDGIPGWPEILPPRKEGSWR